MKKLFIVLLVAAPISLMAQLKLNYNASFTKAHNQERFKVMMDQSIKRYPNDSEMQTKDLNEQFNAAGNLLSPMRYQSPNVGSFMAIIEAHLDKSESKYNNSVLDLAKNAKTLNQKDKYIDYVSLLKVDWVAAAAEYEFNKGTR